MVYVDMVINQPLVHQTYRFLVQICVYPSERIPEILTCAHDQFRDYFGCEMVEALFMVC